MSQAPSEAPAPAEHGNLQEGMARHESGGAETKREELLASLQGIDDEGSHWLKQLLRVCASLAPETLGAVVVRLEPDGSASRAGLRAGDLLIAIDGNPAAGLADLCRRIDTPGEHQVTVRRGDQELTLRVRR